MASPQPPRPVAAAPTRPPRWRRRSTWIALGVLVLLGALRAALPEVLRRLIESNASAALGRRVEVADVDLGLVMGRAAVEGLAVGGADLAAPLDPASAVVHCERIGARIAWLPLFTGRIHLREIDLVAPRLRLERNADGSLAPLVLAAPAPEPEPLPAPESGGGIDLAIDRFSLESAALEMVRAEDHAGIAELRFEILSLGDLSLHEGVFGIGEVTLRGPELQVQAAGLSPPEGQAPPAAAAPAAEAAEAPGAEEAQPAQAPAPEAPKHRIKDLHIEGAHFTWRLPDGEAVAAELELRAENLGLAGPAFPLEIRLTTDGAALALKGQLALEPLAFEGSFDWQGVHLERLARLAPDAPVRVEAGRSDGSLVISLRLPPAAPDAPAGLRLHGDARVANLDLASTDGALSLRWKDLALVLSELTLPLGEAPGAPLAVHLTRLALQEPAVEFVRAAAPAAEPAPSEPAAPAEGGAQESAPPRVAVDELELTGGALRFRDTTVRPAVDTSLKDLRIRARGVRWPERDVETLALRAKGQQGATLQIAGQLAGGAGDIRIDLRQLPLLAFDPYAGAASGLQIERGRLSLASKLSLGKDRFAAKNNLALHQLAVRERESGWFQQAFGIPLDVALALLRDLNGDIALPVDVEQSAGGTRVGIMGAVTSALRQALVGALEAPLKLLGGVVSGAGSLLSSGPQAIPMGPGADDLAPAAHEQVAALAQLLGSRPGLKVQLVGRADASDDAELARREVLARARAGEPLAGDDELGFFERRRVRSALAEADPEQPGDLEPEAAAALPRLASHVQVSEEARQALALARAQAVARSLQEEHGASPDSVASIETRAGAPGVEIELRAASQ